MPRRRITLDWAAKPDYLGGIPRRLVFAAVGAFSKVGELPQLDVCAQLGDPSQSRPAQAARDASAHRQQPHVHVGRSASLGIQGFLIHRLELGTLVACSRGHLLQKIHIGLFLPDRGAGIYQENMDEALDRLSEGEWLHTFPEGKVYQENCPIRRLKWGTASLIVRPPVMPEKSFFGRRPPLPLCRKENDVVVGEPMEFDLVELRQAAKSIPEEPSNRCHGWPTTRH